MSEASSHKPVQASRPDSGSTPPSPSPSSGSSRGPIPDGQTIISSRPPTPDLELQGKSLLESAAHWEGEQLGQFLLQEFVGGGGMGVVYRAHDMTLDREVALKVLSRDQSADEETLRRFRNEAQSAARLGHDNIARVFFVGEDRGVHYIVFEFIEGVNIRDLVDQNGPLSLGQALSYTYQIAQALEHASQRAVIHRDIKPSNVLVTPDGKAKLVDMGLARLSQLAPTGELTASGVTLGTFDYISPEQARDPRSADVRSDLYSLGCSFYFMLTGRPPFPDGTVLQKLLQHQADSPPDPRADRPELPPAVSQILSRLLAKDPNQRYQAASELIDELAALGQSLGMPLSGSHTMRVAPRPQAPQAVWLRHVPWAAPIAALLLIVVGLDVYWSSASESETPLLASPTATSPGRPRLEPPSIDVPEVGPEETNRTDPVPIPPLPKTQPAEPSREVETPIDRSDEEPVPDASSGLPEIVRSLANLQGRILADPDNGNSTEPAEAPPDADDSPDARPPMATSDAVDEHLLIVSDEDGPGKRYSSLQAACSEATSGDVIELQYDGRRNERPIAMADLDLRIRAGEGFRPVVGFRIDQDWNPLKYNRQAMVSVAGGRLKVNDVDWEFDLPQDFPVDWSLFEALGCEGLAFEGCTFTVRGPRAYRAGAAFFEINAPPGTKTMNMGLAVPEGSAVAIDLRNCVARGEATLLRDRDLQPVELTWVNGLLATSERLFVADGSSLLPSREVRAELVLRHVTAIVGGGLVLLTNSRETPYQLSTSIECDDCILATTGSVPLIEQRGSDTIDEYIERFTWSGDHNYFEGFDVFWQIMNPTGQTGSRQFDFERWQDHWQERSRDEIAGSGAVAWKARPDRSRAYHTQVPTDYALDQSVVNNAAMGGAADGSDAGGWVNYLPSPPSENALESSSQGNERREPEDAGEDS